MKAIFIKALLSVFVIAFIASCDDPVKPTETPAPNPALLKYKSLTLNIDDMRRVYYDSVYRWDNSLKTGEWTSEADTFGFGMNISSKTFDNPESTTQGKFRVEGNILIYTFDTLMVHTESTTYRSRNIKLAFDSSLSTIVNCTITNRDSIIGQGTTLDGRTSIQRLHFRTNTGVISNIAKQSEGVYSLVGLALKSAISGFDTPTKITNEYEDGSYSERHTRFGNLIITEKSKVNIELGE